MFKFYEVGGKVRDEFLGLQNKDIDYVAVPDMEHFHKKLLDANINSIFRILVTYLEVEGYQIFLTTPEMYTIRAKFPKGHINEGVTADFVLARKELEYKEGTRLPIIVPGTLLDDLQRRDFTCNAIAKDLDGVIYDPFNGVADIKNKILKTPIDGSITFSDDPLRLLRAIRFSITKGFGIGDVISKQIFDFDYNSKFNVVSEERIREELYKCFKHNTLLTLEKLEFYKDLKNHIFKRTNLWLKPTNEQ